ncbi:hypothetical protein B0H14DRAFT_1648313 [Mycena olivaceomarginata]|nr:hypothetical protein B0H14DRAFT_1648313 [Mycena olivaceomarginata]
MESESKMQTYCRGMQRAVLPHPRSSLSLSRLCPTSSAPFLSSWATTIKSPPCVPLPASRLWALPPRVLVHTISAFDSIPRIMRSRAPDDGVPRTWAPRVAHSEPCFRERAGCGWTGWGRVGRREACMALSTSPSCVVLSIFRVGGEADPGEEERETEDARRCGYATNARARTAYPQQPRAAIRILSG